MLTSRRLQTLIRLILGLGQLRAAMALCELALNRDRAGRLVEFGLLS